MLSTTGEAGAGCGLSLYRTGSALYFATRGRIRVNRFCFRIPERITGVPEEQSGLWYISKIQFIHNLSFGYAMAAWVPGPAQTVSLLLSGVSWFPF